MTTEAADSQTTTTATSPAKWSTIIAAAALLTNLMIAAWFFFETSRLQQLSLENNAVSAGSDSLSTRLKELETKLAVPYADYRQKMSQFMSIINQMNRHGVFPVTDGPAIVSCAVRLETTLESGEERDRYDAPVVLTCYIPPGNHQLIHGFQFDSKWCQLKLPNRVIHPTEPGKIHSFKVSVSKSDGPSVLVISSTSPSSKTTAVAHPLGDNNVSIRFQSAPRSCYRVPNENPGTPDLLEYEIPWNRKSDLPNQILSLHITTGKNSFYLRIGVEADAPASTSSLILASRSRDFLQRLSGEYQLTSSELAIKPWFPGYGQFVPERIPQFEEIFEPPDNSGRLIYREGWAAKTLEPD